MPVPDLKDDRVIDAEDVAAEFGHRLAALGWVTALHVGGSLATGDHRAGVSDLDLVALTDGPRHRERQCQPLRAIHEAVPPTAKLGCTYVPVKLHRRTHRRAHDLDPRTSDSAMAVRNRTGRTRTARLCRLRGRADGDLAQNDRRRCPASSGRGTDWLLVLGRAPTVAVVLDRPDRPRRHHDAPRPTHVVDRRADHQVRGPCGTRSQPTSHANSSRPSAPVVTAKGRASPREVPSTLSPHGG